MTPNVPGVGGMKGVLLHLWGRAAMPRAPAAIAAKGVPDFAYISCRSVPLPCLSSMPHSRFIPVNAQGPGVERKDARASPHVIVESAHLRSCWKEVATCLASASIAS